MVNMKPAFVRSDVDNNKLKISFYYIENGLSISHEFYFDRVADESLIITTTRMSANITKAAVNKGLRLKPGDNNPEKNSVTVSLQSEDLVELDSQILNRDAWITGRRLIIDNSQFVVLLDTPVVKKLALPYRILGNGFLVIPQIDVEFADVNQCVYIWYRSATHNPMGIVEADSKTSLYRSWTLHDGFQDGARAGLSPGGPPLMRIHESADDVKPDSAWIYVHSGYIYRTCAKDVGHYLKLEVMVPTVTLKDGITVERRMFSNISEFPVELFTEIPPYIRIQQNNPRLPTSQGFRVMSYNILANCYAGTSYSSETLFLHCDKNIIHYDYRQMLILNEIMDYKSDVILLQEVDYEFYDKALIEAAKKAATPEYSLAGSCLMKGPKHVEGSVILYNTRALSFVDRHNIHIGTCIREYPMFADILDFVALNEHVKKKVFNLGTVFQVSALKTRNNHVILAATTHLYYQPKSTHIRLIQMMVCLRHLEHVKALYGKQNVETSIIFGGDLNSVPHSGVYDLILNGYLPKNHSDWFASGKGEYFGGMEMSHSLKLNNASGLPRYTNYVPGFQATLDYIFAEGLAFNRLEMPDHNEILRFTALPSPTMPSDHLPVICDVSLQSYTHNSSNGGGP